jgi:outer membrane immunogenic protein
MFVRTLAAAAAALSIATAAQGADMALKAPPRVVVENWTGWNVGASLGARYADVDGTTLSFGGGAPPFPALAHQEYHSWAYRVGGYLGYDWQVNRNWVIGVEGDFAWGDGKKHVDALQGIVFTNTGNYSEVRQTWDAGLRARAGYLLDPSLLLYATGGVQWQHFDATVNCTINTCNPAGNPAGAPFLQTNGLTRTGWAVGGGLEKMFADRWLARVEYRYADFGNSTETFGGAPLIVKAFEFKTHTAYFGIAKKF